MITALILLPPPGPPREHIGGWHRGDGGGVRARARVSGCTWGLNGLVSVLLPSSMPTGSSGADTEGVRSRGSIADDGRRRLVPKHQRKEVGEAGEAGVYIGEWVKECE